MAGNGKISFVNSIGGKILIIFILVSILSLGTLALISSIGSSRSLKEAAARQLHTVEVTKKSHLLSYFKTMENQISILSENPWIQSSMQTIDHCFMNAGDSIDSPEWRTLAKQYDRYFDNISEAYGLHDVVLMCPEGSIVYSQKKQGDLGLFVTEEPLQSTPFGEAFNKLQQNSSIEMAYGDFAPYEPSGGMPSAFLVARMRDPYTSEVIGHIGFSLSVDSVNEIIQERAGMGETAETYLVGFDKDGTISLRSDRVIKSGNILDKKSDHIIEKTMNQEASGVEVKTGSTGDQELVSFSSFELEAGLTWGIFSTMAMDEINAPILVLIIQIIIVTLVILLIVVVIAIIFSKSITTPVKASVEFANRIAAKDLTIELDRKYSARKDEMGLLAGALSEMQNSLKGMMGEMNTGMGSLAAASTELLSISEEMSKGADLTTEKAGTVAAASEELNANSTSVAAGMEQSSTNLNSVATATEEMTATINQIAQNTESARSIAEKAVDQSKQVSELMDVLGESALEIGKVTETITSISDQTNLLALNATIEAARAGEAGKGFAVVASEIKDLAKQTAAATEDIKGKINGIQTSTNNSIVDIKKIAEIVQNVNDYITTIASAVEEQSITTKDISENMGQASAAVQDASERTAQNSTVSQDIAKEISEVSSSADEMSVASNQVAESAKELSGLSERLKAMVDQYNIGGNNGVKLSS